MQSIQQVEPVRCASENVHLARMNAHTFVFENNRLLDHPIVFQSVREISECYRKIIGKKIDMEDVQRTRLDLLARLNIEEANLKAAVMKASTTIVAVVQDNLNADIARKLVIQRDTNQNIKREGDAQRRAK